MSRSFRFEPPEPRPDLLLRPRLLRSLKQRWQHRITYLAGGPGLGKTTLLAQAMADNRLEPQGEDVWIAMEASDAHADHLGRVVASALAGGEVEQTSDLVGAQLAIPPAAVADAVWQRAPTEACLVLDDVHLVPAGSTGAAWLGRLIDAMPANGHLVLASRSDPPVPLSRYRGQVAVLQLFEDDLRFSDDELGGFAARRGIDRDQFVGTGGWPAMAELAASAGQAFTGDYLWEQVLEPLGPMRRQVLATVCELGGADDDLASAALGMRVDLAQVFAGVPLVGRRSGGWYVPHDLWRSTPGMVLSPAERAEVRRRAATHFVDRRSYDEAFALLHQAEIWDGIPAVLRAACLASDRISADQLARWIAVCPAEVGGSSAGALASGFHAAMTALGQASEPLLDAITRCRTDGDIDAELAAIAQLGLVAWSRQDPAALEKLTPRVAELEAAGHPVARALMTLRAAFAEDILGNDERVLHHLGRIEPGVLPGANDAMVGALTAAIHLGQGYPERSLQVLEQLSPTADPAIRWFFDGIGLVATQACGRIDETLAASRSVAAAASATGLGSIGYPVLTITSTMHSHAGDLAAARRYIEEASPMFQRPAGRLPVLAALATASLRLAEGDEGGAATILAQAMERRGIDNGLLRRWWRHTLALTYVLVPAARRHWDTTPLDGHYATSRDLARLVVAVRTSDATATLRTAELPTVDVMRSLLHYRHAAELAVGLAAAGRPEGLALLDALGRPGRDAVRALSDDPHQAKSAKALLAAAPAPPSRRTYLAVLGPLAVRRDGPGGEEVVEPDLRRQRVQALLAFLINNRHTTRSKIMASLWPDMDERAAANNLAVTMSRLLRLLDPERGSGEPSYYVRMDGQTVRLVSDEHLRIDLDDFDGHRAAAARAEEESGPSVALDQHLAAVELYRGELCLDVEDAEWLTLPREHYRARFVHSAVRAAQLLLAQGDTDRAEAVAHQTLAADPWAEDAYAVLVGVALARHDRSAASRLLTMCVDALAELGVEPSDATTRLQRRVAES